MSHVASPAPEGATIAKVVTTSRDAWPAAEICRLRMAILDAEEALLRRRPDDAMTALLSTGIRHSDSDAKAMKKDPLGHSGIIGFGIGMAILAVMFGLNALFRYSVGLNSFF